MDKKEQTFVELSEKELETVVGGSGIIWKIGGNNCKIWGRKKC